MEGAEATMEEIASRASDTTLPENNPLQLLGQVEVSVGGCARGKEKQTTLGYVLVLYIPLLSLCLFCVCLCLCLSVHLSVCLSLSLSPLPFSIGFEV